MISDTVLIHEDQLIEDHHHQRAATRHFSVVRSEEEEENDENRITSDEEPSPPGVEKFEDKSLNKLYDDWLALGAEFRTFESKHKENVSKSDDVESLKATY